MANRLNPKRLYYMPDSGMCCAIPEMTARPHFTYVREEDYNRVVAAATMAFDIARRSHGHEPLEGSLRDPISGLCPEENETEFQSDRKEAALTEIYGILKGIDNETT